MIFIVNFKTLSSLIKSAFVGVWTLQISKCTVQYNDKNFPYLFAEGTFKTYIINQQLHMYAVFCISYYKLLKCCDRYPSAPLYFYFCYRVYINYTQQYTQFYLFIPTLFYVTLTVHKLTFRDHVESLRHSLKS